MAQSRPLSIVAAMLILTFSSTALAQSDIDRFEEIRAKVREAVDHFDQGQLRAAKQVLDEALTEAPTAEEAYMLVQQVGQKKLTQMMLADARTSEEAALAKDIARQVDVIWRLYVTHRKRQARDEERIKTMVDKVVDPSVHEVVRWRIILQLQDVGQFAVPELAKYLGDEQDDERRSLARFTIQRLGSQAVLPVIELLESANTLTVQNACLILGDIEPADQRAIAPLKAVAESTSEEAPDEVRRHARRSLEKITGMRANELKPAYEYYYRKARRYYLEAPSVPAEEQEADGVIWRMSADGNLEFYEVPHYAWNEKMAEQAVYDLMELHPQYEAAVPLFVSVMAAQYREVKDLMDIVAERPVGRPLSEAEMLEVRERNILMREANMLIHAAGPRPVYDALGMALEDGRMARNRDKFAGVAVVLIDAIKDLDPYGHLLPGEQPIYISAAGRADPRFDPNAPPMIEELPSEDGMPAAEPVEGEEAMVDESALVEEEPMVDEDAFVEEEGMGEGEEMMTEEGAEGEEGAEQMQPLQQRTVRHELVQRGGPDGAPLIAALTYDDKRVRYAAAIALARMNPPQRFEGTDLVAEELASAIGESGPLQVLLIEEDGEVRNTVRAKLESLGLQVSMAAEPREGLARAVRFPPKDLIVVGNNLTRGFTTLQLLKELRGDPRTRYTPTMVLTSTSEYDNDRQRFPEYMLLSRDAGGIDLQAPIRKATTWPTVRAMPVIHKLHAEAVSIAAANALLEINPLRTHITPADATQALIAALKNRSDEVRNPCAKALGKFRLPGYRTTDGAFISSVEVLKDLFQEPANSPQLRANALRAIGQINPVEARDLASQALDRNSGEPLAIRAIASDVIGKSDASSEELLPIFMQHRPPHNPVPQQ